MIRGVLAVVAVVVAVETMNASVRIDGVEQPTISQSITGRSRVQTGGFPRFPTLRIIVVALRNFCYSGERAERVALERLWRVVRFSEMRMN